MKKILLWLSVMLVTSCVPKNLAGSYPNQIYRIESEESYEAVWARCMDYLTLNGISVFSVDKACGKIVTSKISFINNYTREIHGQPHNPAAYVVVPTVRVGPGRIVKPTSMAGNWIMNGECNVRIRESNGKRIVNVNLTKLTCSYYTGRRTLRVPIRSTGVFEQELLEYLSR